jgi:hypothetical protein
MDHNSIINNWPYDYSRPVSSGSWTKFLWHPVRFLLRLKGRLLKVSGNACRWYEWFVTLCYLILSFLVFCFLSILRGAQINFAYRAKSYEKISALSDPRKARKLKLGVFLQFSNVTHTQHSLVMLFKMGYNDLLCLCEQAPEIDFWINLRRLIKSRELSVNFLELQCLPFVGIALIFDLVLLITLFVRLVVLNGTWGALDMVAFYDATILSFMLVHFLMTVVAMNEETQRVHLQILERQR